MRGRDEGSYLLPWYFFSISSIASSMSLLWGMRVWSESCSSFLTNSLFSVNIFFIRYLRSLIKFHPFYLSIGGEAVYFNWNIYIYVYRHI